MKMLVGLSICIAIGMMFFASSSFAQTDEYIVVANKQLAGNTINKASLKGIYLREVRNWGNGGAEIVPVDLSTEDNFYQNLFAKSYVQMQAYWMKMRINYNANMPVTKKDAESVKEFIASNKDAIGFIKSSDMDDRVKALKIVN
jgi:ABC-type phosphate transport system substrate-binding protein